ncbi:MAG: type II toxin-antitoxin system antitoxin SocA domain-containing protein [Pseudomonadota bacterium]
MAYDPRAICNLILDEARRTSITHVALQKLLYFAHGLHLIRTEGNPLVKGYFEAWRHGPVHPTAYKAFKQAGADVIDFRAVSRDPLTQETRALLPNIDDLAYDCVVRTVANFGSAGAWTLVQISHAEGAPWKLVVDSAENSVNFGMRISNDVIRENFNKHKVSIKTNPGAGEPSEEAPLDFADRSSSDRAAR